MNRFLTALLILATGTVSANDALRPFFERPLEQIDGVTIQQSWLFGTQQSRKYGGSLLFKDGQVLVVVEENKTPKEKSSNWVFRNVQTLGAKADGKYLSSCYTTEGGRTGDYIVLVDKNVFVETADEYYSFKKIWKFNSKSLQFETIAAKQLRCQCEDCPK